MSKTLISLSAAASLAVALLLPAGPAQAVEDNRLEGATAAAIESHYAEFGADPVPLRDATEVTVTPTGSSGQELSVAVPSPPEHPTTRNTDADSVSFFTDETTNGVRIISTIPTESAVSELVYEIGGVLDPYLVELDGGYKVLDANDQYVADLGAPWALDASGKYLPTHYTLANNQLSQAIDYTDAVFPVVADPAWTYAVDHASYTLITGKEKASPARVMAELRRCFNCSFPVSGAPRAFPSVGQTINLNASPFTLIKVPAPVRVSAVVSDGFNFVALPGHFDGANSTISFRFYNDRSGWLHISVVALIYNDRGAAANEANRSIASQTWANFLANLIRQRTL